MIEIVELIIRYPLLSLISTVIVCAVFPVFGRFMEAAFFLFASCAALVWLAKVVAP